MKSEVSETGVVREGGVTVCQELGAFHVWRRGKARMRTDLRPRTG